MVKVFIFSLLESFAENGKSYRGNINYGKNEMTHRNESNNFFWREINIFCVYC